MTDGQRAPHRRRRRGLVFALGVAFATGAALIVMAPFGSTANGRTDRVLRSASVRGRVQLPGFRAHELTTRSLVHTRGGYSALADGLGFRLINKRQRITAQITRAGAAVVQLNRATLTLRLASIAFGNTEENIGRLRLAATANRITYRAPGWSEWYANEPAGIEQGFTISSRPAHAAPGPLVLRLGVGGNLHPEGTGRQDSVTFAGAGTALAYRGLIASDAAGNALPARIVVHGRELLLRVQDKHARYPIQVDPFIASSPTSSPYAQAVLADNPTIYYRLDEPGGPVAYDSSLNGLDGAYQNGVTFGTAGAIATDQTDTAISSSGLAVTQSGTTLPSANAARTVEFWLQGGVQNPVAITYGGGGGGTNDQFRVEVYGGQLWLSVDSSQLYTSGQYVLNLPQSWWNGNWHLFDVTYDGTSALGYMDGQLVGDFGVRTPLATALGAPLHIGDRADVGAGTNTYSLDEFAIYPTPLSAARINAHWTLGDSAAGSCATSPTSPYASTVLHDSPSLYLRLDEPAADATRYVAFDSSGHCTAQAPTNATYLPGVQSVQGATFGDDDTGISASGPAVTQSGGSLPAGDSARTIEFWIRGGRQNPIAFTYGGGSGTNDQFRVELWGGQLWLATNSSQPYGSAQYSLDLPEAWWDGNWHLFDITYNGSKALCYMDGQLVGSFGVLTPLATSAKSPLRIGDRVDFGVGDGPYALDEFAVYPTALSASRIDAHWTAQDLTPPGQSIVEGTANLGGGGGAQGARVQACPTSGGTCTVDPYPVDQFGLFHFLVPNGMYTITIFPPAGSPSLARTFGPFTLPPNVLNVTTTFSPPGALPDGVSFATPSTGTQQNVVPRANWGEPITITVTGQCTGGFGAVYIMGPNPSTGQTVTRSAQFVESPVGSGTYVAKVPPVAPLHGVGSIDPQIACPGQTPVLPDGGPAHGGSETLISGTGFTGANGVMFGSQPASSFTVLSDNFIEATAPAGTGSVPITVTKPASSTNHAASLSAGTFHYFDVTSISPTSGPATGGNTITIFGHGFTNVKGVVFGLQAAPSFTVVNSGEIQAQAPVGMGTVNVQVMNGFALSKPSAASQYTYTGGPSCASNIVEPVTGTDGDAASLAIQISSSCGTSGDYGVLGGGQISQSVNEWNNPPAPPEGQPDQPEGWGWEDNLGVGEQLINGGLAIAGCLTAETGNPVSIGLCAAGAVMAVEGMGHWVYDEIQKFHLCITFLDHSCKGLFDPSGTVVDTNGNPVNNATATILVQGSPGGSFTPVDPASGTIDPATNPETTGSSGAFDWDALAGTYEIEASAGGCHAPADASQPNVFTSPFLVPPPVTGLVLTLDCGVTAPPKPTVGGLTPGAGPSAGGNTIEITGTNLAGVTGVDFGPTSAPHFEALSPYAIVAVVPAGSGTVDVTVASKGGTSATVAADKYRYLTPVTNGPESPTVARVSPARGPVSGGTVVSISGTHLTGAFAVSFGGTAASQVTPVSANEVKAVAPAAVFPARVDITVTTSAGTSLPTTPDLFTYGSPPAPTATAVSIMASPKSPAYGKRVTLTAVVAPTDGGGKVEFAPSGTVSPISGCASVGLKRSGSGYKATCFTTHLGGGKQTITAAYSGDASYAASKGSTDVFVVVAPRNVTPPSISGTPRKGHALSEGHGTWTNHPTSYRYRWEDCSRSGGACVVISGASANTYSLRASDVGHTIRVEEIAVNAAGASRPATSRQTAVVSG
jgi:hypothetical protein